MNISELIETMMTYSNLKEDDFARMLSVKSASFRTKLNLNRFSIEELVAISEVCGCEISVKFLDDDMVILRPEDICNKELLFELEKAISMQNNLANHQFMQELKNARSRMTPEQYKNLINTLDDAGFNVSALAELLDTNENSD